MNVLDLFSGIGGFSLGLEAAGMQTVAFCEIETYCRAVLRKHWPDVPIHDDVRALDGGQYRGTVDLVCGGYPCQPFSMAGRRAGAEDERHLWPEMLRIIRGVRPRWVVAENVAGHISLGFDEVATSLEAEGFAVWPFVIPACAVGAPHRRDRLWILAHARRSRIHERRITYDAEGKMSEPRGMGGDGLSCGYFAKAKAVANTARLQSGRQKQRAQRKRVRAGRQSIPAPMADADQPRLEGRNGAGLQERASERSPWPGGASMADAHGEQKEWASDPWFQRDPWIVEPDVGRVASRVPHRVDRLRALGNAIVPQIAAIIGQAIMTFESEAT